MSCKKVVLFELNDFREILYNFYPKIKDDQDEIENYKRIFYEQSLIDVSNFAKFIVFAVNNQVAALGFKPIIENFHLNKSHKLSQQVKSYKFERDEQITCIKILPFYSQHSSSIYTFILVGLNSGFVNVLNESLICVFKYQFKETAVIDLKLFHFPNEDKNDSLYQSTILIHYEDDIIKMNGIELVALVRNNENKLQNDQDLSNKINHEIWKLNQSLIVNDFIYHGSTYETIYDDLIDRTLYKKYSNLCYQNRSNLKKDVLISVGKDPFISFYDLNIHKSEITIKNTLKTIVTSYIFGDNKDEPRITCNEATNIFNFNKIQQALSIILAPKKNFALITDKNSVVSLLDIKRKEILRFWKNYKNCKCSFLEVNNPLNNNKSRALFVLLLKPEESIIEIWPCKFGDKIVSLPISKNCYLAYKNFNFFTTKNFSLKTDDFYENSTVLFDYETFTGYTFEISFLCSVIDHKISSKEDMLLQEIFKIINTNQFNKKELNLIFDKLSNPESKLFVLKVILETNDLDLIEYSLDSLKNKRIENLNDEENNLNNVLNSSKKLLNVYNYIEKFNYDLENFKIKKNLISESPQDITEESEILHWRDTDFVTIFSLFTLGEYLNPENVDFNLPSLTINEFMKFFNLELERTYFELKTSCILLKSKNDTQKLSTFLFSYLFLKEQDLKIIDYYVENCISPLNLLYLLFDAWISNSFVYNWKTWKLLLKVSNYLVELHRKQIEDVHEFKDTLLSSLKSLCPLILKSSFIQASIVGTYVLQTLNEIYYKQNKNLPSLVEENDWVEIQLDEESFSLLLKQLEDLYLLNLLLGHFSKETDLTISLKNLIESNNYLVSELVAKHCVRNLIDADLIAKQEDIETNTIDINFQTEIDKTLKLINEIDIDLFDQLLKHASLRFPWSLKPCILLSNCALESIKKFLENPTISNQVHLQQCLNYLDKIKDPILKHKMAILIWKIYLGPRLCNMSKILFREKNWNFNNLAELKIEEAILEPFSLFIHDFIEFILNTINNAAISEPIEYKKDELWMPEKNRSFKNPEQKSIIDLALNLKISNPNLAIAHLHVALLCNLTICFKENVVKSLKYCFSDSLLYHLFKNLSDSFTFDEEEKHLKKSREMILIKFAQRVGRSVPIVTIRSPNEMEKDSFRQANAWITKLIELAKDWNVDEKLIRHAFVYMLYTIGCDTLAKETLFFIKDEEFVGRIIITLLPQRLTTLYENNIFDIISLLPMEIIKEIQKNPYKRVDFEVTYNSTKQFLECLIPLLTEGTSYFKIASLTYQTILQHFKNRKM